MTGKDDYIWGTGRRKRSVARVRIRSGNGKITINGRPHIDYFPLEKCQHIILEPLRAVKAQRNFDVWANISGGGYQGQAGAFIMGLGRALCHANREFEDILRDRKFLTRDSRMVERKKYGRKKARKSFQFSKR